MIVEENATDNNHRFGLLVIQMNLKTGSLSKREIKQLSSLL